MDKAVAFAATKSANGITSCIYLEAKDDNLTIKATDMKAGFTSTIKVNVEVPGKTAVYADKLSAILKNMPKNDLILETREEMLYIYPTDAKKVNVGIRTLDAERFPEQEKKNGSIAFSIKSADLIKMANSVSFAVGSDMSRAFLTGVYMEAQNDVLYLVATDSKRLAAVSYEGAFGEFGGQVIPVRFFQFLNGTLGEYVTITLGNGTIFAESEAVTISCSTLGDRYPAWRKVVPANAKFMLKMNVANLERAINLTSIMSDAKTRSLFLDLEENQMMVRGQDANYGHSKQILDCEYEGEKVTVQFNSLLLPPLLKGIETTNLIAKFNDGQKAWLFTPEGSESLIYVIMPMSLTK